MSNQTSDGPNASQKVLLADDEPVTRRMYCRFLENSGLNVISAVDGEDALSRMTPDVVVAVIDLNMPGISGLECMRRLQESFPRTEVLIISGVGEIRDAVAAMREGACDYVAKPCDQNELVAHVSKAIYTANLRRENQVLWKAMEQPASSTRFAAKTAASKDLLEKIGKLAHLDSTVLLTGESGTGKTTVARMVHDRGPRGGRPFVSVNCASLPRDLIEAELFGHVKGAFTGAAEDRPGRAEIADGGTLFLDEIGDLPLELQPKLLTFLQDRTLQRIGSNRVTEVDVRVIAATHQDLASLSEQRRFRPDLYYRLNVLHLDVLPLRDRRADIPEVAVAVLERIAKRRGTDFFELDDQAMLLLQQHDWPGNIRELENVLERATAFCSSARLGVSDLELVPGIMKQGGDSESREPSSYVGLTLREIEKRALTETLAALGGNKAMAARQLGVSEKSIYNKLKRFGMFEQPGS